MIGSSESEGPVLAWTQIPVLEETMFRAEMVAGRPALSPLPMGNGVTRARARASRCLTRGGDTPSWGGSLGEPDPARGKLAGCENC